MPGKVAKDESSLFDGVDTNLVALAQYAGANPPSALTDALKAITASVKRAQDAFDAGKDADTATPVEEGLTTVRWLRHELAVLKIKDAARYEIDFRLATKERDFEDAVIAAHGLTFEAIADDGLVVPGQAGRVSVLAQNRGASDVGVTVTAAGVDATGGCAPGPAKKDGFFTCSVDAHIPKNAALTTPYFDDDYWKHPANSAINKFDPDVPFGTPFRATPFQVTFHVKADAVEVAKTLPV